MRTSPRALALLLALALAAAACGGDDTGGGAEGGGPAADDEDVLVIAAAGLPTGFNFDLAAGGYENAEARANLNATLVRNRFVEVGDGEYRQDYLSFEPVLAESYEVSDDGLTFTFHLREDAVSHAGNPLTAEDVRYTMERKWNIGGNTPSTAYPVITDPASQITVIDDHTISYTLAEAGYGVTFLSMMSNNLGHVVDSDLLKEHATPEDPWASEWAEQNDYGFGPYKLGKVTPGEQVVFEAFDEFVLGPPAYDRIIMRTLPDPGTRLSALRNGDVDIAVQLRPADQKQVLDDPDVRIPSVSSNIYTFIPLNTTKPPFDDVRVRQAFALAIPYEEIIEEVYLGKGSKMKGMLLPEMPGHDESLPERTYDPAAATAILEEAGIATPVAINLVVDSSYADLRDAAVRIRTAASAAGFDVTIEELPTAAYLEGRVKGAFQLFLVRDYAIVQSPAAQLLLFTKPESNLNWAKWDSPRYHQVIEEAIAAGDPASDAAVAKWQEALAVMEAEMPYIWVTTVDPLLAYSSDVTGYAQRSDNVLYYHQLAPAR